MLYSFSKIGIIKNLYQGQKYEFRKNLYSAQYCGFNRIG